MVGWARSVVWLEDRLVGRERLVERAAERGTNQKRIGELNLMCELVPGPDVELRPDTAPDAVHVRDEVPILEPGEVR